MPPSLSPVSAAIQTYERQVQAVRDRSGNRSLFSFFEKLPSPVCSRCRTQLNVPRTETKDAETQCALDLFPDSSSDSSVHSFHLSTDASPPRRNIMDWSYGTTPDASDHSESSTISSAIVAAAAAPRRNSQEPLRRRVLRSMGNVPDQPNVQPRNLERKIPQRRLPQNPPSP